MTVRAVVFDVGETLVDETRAWGRRKPSPELFARVVQAAGLPPEQIAYVGDRLDNDVLPAADAGMTSVFLRRGPWAHLQASRPELARARLRLDPLVALPEALRSHST